MPNGRCPRAGRYFQPELLMTTGLSANTERRLLQGAVLVFALIPISAGVMGVLYGPLAFDNSAVTNLSVDSHTRYLSGLLLAIGLAFWSTIPTIEKQRERARILTVIVFIGGLARLYGVIIAGTPPAPMLGGLVMELVVTPALALWRERIDGKFR